MPTPITEGATSPKTLIEWHNRLGIPHFQRGLVWDPESVALLLESLFWHTPCGSIIFWTPTDIHVQGRGLGAPDVGPECLIIDGQQRIRSLFGAWGDDAAADDAALNEAIAQDDELEPDTSSDEPGDGEVDRCWCLNLSRLDAFKETFPGGERFRLFRLAKNPLLGQGASVRPQPGQKALLPLRWFVENTDAQVSRFLDDASAPGADAIRAVLGNEDVASRLRSMLTREAFHVSILPAERTLAHVVDIYNRINSGGIRVEPEEKAFANLAAAYHGTGREIEAFFSSVSASEISVGQRDDLLERQRESRFGFKLFMRVFVLGLAYHRGESLGSSSLSFKAAERDVLTTARQEDLGEILDSTRRILGQVRELLEGETLHCDDLRFLPDTASLWPVFQLLTRFPVIASSARNWISSAVLRLTVANLPKKDLLDLCEEIGKANDVESALSVIDQADALRPARIETAVRAGISRAQSLTDRFALVLYWLLRHRGGRDFSYEKNLGHEPSKLKEMITWSSAAQPKRDGEPPEARIERSARPEKQHIVPVSLLKKVYGLSEGSRPGRHEINAIGNLTYMSGCLNGYVLGVGPSPLKLRDEPDAAVLDAHMLGPLVDSFEEACRLAGGDRGAKESFRKFCESRAELITSALVRWMWELHDKGLADRVVDTPPAVRLLTEESRLIRSFAYPPSVKERLVRLFEIPGVSAKARAAKHAVMSICFERKSAGRRKQVLRLDVRPDRPDGDGVHPTRELRVTIWDLDWTSAFVAAFPDVRRIPMSKGVGRFQIDGDSTAEQVAEVIDWLAARVSAGDLSQSHGS